VFVLSEKGWTAGKSILAGALSGSVGWLAQTTDIVQVKFANNGAAGSVALGFAAAVAGIPVLLTLFKLGNGACTGLIDTLT